MSYSLPMRALRALRRPSSARLWRDEIANVLNSTIALQEKHQLMQSWEGALHTPRAVEDSWRELGCLDLSPSGLFFAQTRSFAGISYLWDAYSRYTDVIDPSVCSAQGIAPIKAVSRVHWHLLGGYEVFFQESLARNRAAACTPQPRRCRSLPEVMRILDAPLLVRDACEFFHAFPQAKVLELYIALNMHPRTGERRLAAEGVSAMALKRACALSSASRYIVWSQLSLADIADNAALPTERICTASSGGRQEGSPPSAYRQAARFLH